ncbi:MAG: thioredoxin domain-containing protein [Actinomycetota bacterium]
MEVLPCRPIFRLGWSRDILPSIRGRWTAALEMSVEADMGESGMGMTMKALVCVSLAALAIMYASVHAHAAEPAKTIDVILGNADAPITIVLLGSTTCGACSGFHKNVMPKLKAEWIDTGRPG